MKMTLETKKKFVGLAFISPFLVGLAIIFFPSIIRGLVFSFSEINIAIGGYTLTNIGFEHYRNALYDNPWFVQELVASIWNMLLNVPLIIAFSFFIAGILNQRFKGRTLARSILFLPVIVSAGVIAKVDNIEVLLGLAQSEQTEEVLTHVNVSAFFLRAGLPPQFVTYVTDAISRIYQVIIDSGVQILIFLAALQTIPPSLYEASAIEGATGWENFWKITFPMLSPYILTAAVYGIIDLLSSYRSPVMNVITYTATGMNANMPYSIAMSFLFFSAVIAILVFFIFLISKIVFYYD